MSDHELSHETREALGNLKTYLAGGNEAVQYAFSFLADLVHTDPGGDDRRDSRRIAACKRDRH